MTVRNPDDFIQVNGALNLKPSFGPVPADQLIPWSVIALTNIVVANRILGLSWIVTILSIGWGIATWWILTGSDASRFLSKFHSAPYWLYGNLPYLSPLNPAQSATEKPMKRKWQQRSRRPKRMRTDF